MASLFYFTFPNAAFPILLFQPNQPKNAMISARKSIKTKRRAFFALLFYLNCHLRQKRISFGLRLIQFYTAEVNLWF